MGQWGAVPWVFLTLGQATEVASSGTVWVTVAKGREKVENHMLALQDSHPKV